MTFLIFIYSDSIADTSRGLFIGKELTKLNHKVKFAGGENEYKNLITKEGYYYYSLPEMPLELARKLSKEGVVFTYKILTEFVKSELEILEKESPDVCISSFRLSSYVSTRIAKIPLISIGYYYWYKEFYSTIKPFIYNKKYFPKSCKDNPQNIDQLGFNAYVFARLLKSNGFKEFTTFDRILRTDLNIILDLPGLFPRLENCDWPSDIYIAGPFIWEPSFNNHDEIEYEIIKFKKDQKLIAISFGSTGNKRDLEIILKNRLPNQYKIIVYGRNVSKIQNEMDKVRRNYLVMVKAVALLSFPFMAYLFVTAPDIIHLVYGDNWIVAVPLVRIFCFCGMVQSITSLGGTIYLSKGRADLQFTMALISTFLLSIVLYIAVHHGIESVAFAYTLFYLIWANIAIFVVAKLISLKISKLYKIVWTPFIFSMLLILIMLGIKKLIFLEPLSRVVSFGIIGLIIYAILILLARQVVLKGDQRFTFGEL